MQDFFACEAEKEAEAHQVQDRVAKSRLLDLYHEARIQYIINYNSDVLGRAVKRVDAREMMLARETDLTREQYLQVNRKH